MIYYMVRALPTPSLSKNTSSVWRPTHSSFGTFLTLLLARDYSSSEGVFMLGSCGSLTNPDCRNIHQEGTANDPSPVGCASSGESKPARGINNSSWPCVGSALCGDGTYLVVRDKLRSSHATPNVDHAQHTEQTVSEVLLCLRALCSFALCSFPHLALTCSRRHGDDQREGIVTDLESTSSCFW